MKELVNVVISCLSEECLWGCPKTTSEVAWDPRAPGWGYSRMLIFWQPGYTCRENCFLSPFMLKIREMANPPPPEGLSLQGHAILILPVNLPTSPCPIFFLLTQTIYLPRKWHHETESYSVITFSSTLEVTLMLQAHWVDNLYQSHFLTQKLTC